MKAKERPQKLQGETQAVATGCGTLYITVNMNEGQIFEVFAKHGKSGGCSACQMEALTRCISIGLRAGVDPEEYRHTLINISCNMPTFTDGNKVASCPDAIAQVIKGYINDSSGNSGL